MVEKGGLDAPKFECEKGNYSDRVVDFPFSDGLFEPSRWSCYMHIVMEHSVEILANIPGNSIGCFAQQSFEGYMGVTKYVWCTFVSY